MATKEEIEKRLNKKEQEWRDKLGFPLQTGVDNEEVELLKKTVNGEETDPFELGRIEREEGEWGPDGQPSASEQLKFYKPKGKSEILSKKEKVNKPTTADKFSDLRYPYSAITNTMDFMKFSVYKYVRDGVGTVTSRNEESSLKKDRLGAVFLPIPSQLVDSNTTDYGQGSLNFIQEAGIESGSALIGGDGEGAAKAVNRMVRGITGNSGKDLVSNYAATQAVNALLGGNLPFSEVMARSSGNVLNPNMELLFKGPTLRNFNFQFKFTPRFQKEAETIRTIIKVFKRNMAPRTQNAELLKTPNIFEIQYIGKARDYLNRMKLCALRNVTMNYTGEGNFATYNDGSPISMIMTLSFTELTPIYNEDYGAYDDASDGVGY